MEHLSDYLNDHLAGSVAALELLERLIKNYEEQPLGQFFQNLHNEIEADQEILKGLIQKLGEHESKVRKAGGWLIEKLSRPKIPLDESAEGEMGLFMALEALVLGITGKQILWNGLAGASASTPGLEGLDYASLARCATEQRERVEAKRLELAGRVFINTAKDFTAPAGFR